MDFLEMMARQRGGGSNDGSGNRPIIGDELADLLIDFQPIKDLKPGDLVEWKSLALKDCRIPMMGQRIAVSRVFDEPRRNRSEASNHIGDTLDFATLFEGDDEDKSILEYCFDSRRFKRVK